jgi:hypothetical protein
MSESIGFFHRNDVIDETCIESHVQAVLFASYCGCYQINDSLYFLDYSGVLMGG